MHIRVCRDCGEEYRLDAQVSACADCGGPIESRDEAKASSAPAVPQGPYRRLFTGDRAAELDPAAERLGQAGIPFAVRGGKRHPLELWVPAASLKQARELFGLSEEVVEEAPPPGPRRCPACDAELTGAENDCPGCGLAVGALEAPTCEECGAPADPDGGACPSCGQ